MLSNAYASAMNPEINPFRHFTKIVRFQFLTILALMWSVVFSVWSGIVILAGGSMAVHAILLVSIFLLLISFVALKNILLPVIERSMSSRLMVAPYITTFAELDRFYVFEGIQS